MIWPFILLATVILAVASELRRKMSLYAIAYGLVFVVLAKGFLPGVVFWPASSAIWVAVALFIGVVSKLKLPAMLVLIAGALVVPARLTGESYEIGDPYLLASDAMGCAAVIVLGWPAISDFIGRVAGMVGNHRGYHFGGVSNQISQKVQKE